MTTLSQAAQAMVSVFAAVVDERGAWYCSAPVTTGRRYFAWLEDIGQTFEEIDHADEHYRSHHQKAVIEPNANHARQVITALRSRIRVPVIDPTSLPPQRGWTQDNWRDFWAEIIRRFVTCVVFVDHWEYSNGCAFEFLTAHRKGIPTVSEKDALLSLSKGTDMIAEAVRQIAKRGGNTNFLSQVIVELEDLARVQRES